MQLAIVFKYTAIDDFAGPQRFSIKVWTVRLFQISRENPGYRL